MYHYSYHNIGNYKALEIIYRKSLIISSNHQQAHKNNISLNNTLIFPIQIIKLFSILMSISNPFTRSSPFRPVSYNNKIQQAQPAPSFPSNYPKWEPKYSAVSQYPSSYTANANRYNNSINAGYNTIDTPPNIKQDNYLNISNVTTYKRQYDSISKDYTTFDKPSSLTSRTNNNPFNRSTLFKGALQTQQNHQRTFEYDNLNKFQDLRYQGTKGKSYNSPELPNQNFMREYQNKYLKKMDSRDWRSSQLKDIGFDTKQHQYEYDKYGYRQSSVRQITDIDHLRYEPSSKQLTKQTINFPEEIKSRDYHFSEKKIGQYGGNKYLEDETGKFGGIRSKTNNQEQSDFARYDYHQYEKCQAEPIESKFGITNDFLKSSNQYSEFPNYDPDDESSMDNSNKYGFLNQQQYRQVHKNREQQIEQRRKVLEFEDFKEDSDQEQPYFANKMIQSNKSGRIREEERQRQRERQRQIQKQKEKEVEKQREMQRIQRERQMQGRQRERKMQRQMQKQKQKQSSNNERGQQSEQDSCFDFNKEDSFDQNFNKPSKYKIWDREVQNQSFAARKQYNNYEKQQYTQPCFGRNPMNKQQFNSHHQFYSAYKNNAEQKIADSSFNSIRDDDIVRFDDSDLDIQPRTKNSRLNTPSGDIDSKEKYPKIIQIQGTLFHRIQLDN